MLPRRTTLLVAALVAGSLSLIPAVSAPAADHPGRAYAIDSPPGANDWECQTSAEHPNPVILVHGLGAQAGWNWQQFSPQLVAEGYCVFAIDYGRREEHPPPFDRNGGLKPIEESAAQLALFVDAVLEATSAGEENPKVDIVGHSEGSFMPNWYVKFLGGAQYVDRYVGLTPLWDGTDVLFGGTMSEAGRDSGFSDQFNERFFEPTCQACPQLLKGSDTVKAMNEGPTGPRVEGVTYTMIMTTYDELVVPYTSGIMDGATNIVIQDQCLNDVSEHMAVAFDPVVLRNILNALDPASAQPISCGAGLTYFQQ